MDGLCNAHITSSSLWVWLSVWLSVLWGLELSAKRSCLRPSDSARVAGMSLCQTLPLPATHCLLSPAPAGFMGPERNFLSRWTPLVSGLLYGPGLVVPVLELPVGLVSGLGSRPSYASPFSSLAARPLEVL
jgi:hypothetical protein